MNPNHAKKAERTENILSSLSRLDYLTRSQLQTLHGLGSARNANRVLNGLGDYLSTFRVGLEKVYYLSKAGRDYVGSETVRKKTLSVDHYLLRNQLYLYLRRPSTWRNEARINAGDFYVVADAAYRSDKRHYFVEVDVTQPMHDNRKKIERYARIQRMTADPFALIFVTNTESRRPKIERLCNDAGVTSRVYTAREIT